YARIHPAVAKTNAINTLKPQYGGRQWGPAAVEKVLPSGCPPPPPLPAGAPYNACRICKKTDGHYWKKCPDLKAYIEKCMLKEYLSSGEEVGRTTAGQHNPGATIVAPLMG